MTQENSSNPKTYSLKQPTFGLISGIVFSLLASLHTIRLIYGWEAQIAEFSVPMWLSCVTIIISSSLAYWGFKYSK